MTEVLRDIGVVVDHPADGVYEVAAGDVDWLFVPLEAAAKMRASFILLGTAAGALRAGHHQQPRRRPDRAAAGEPPRRRDAGAGRRDRLPRRLLLRPGAGPAARRRDRLSAGHRDGHRERDARGDARARATRRSGRRPQEPEVDDLIDFLRKMGADVKRTSPDTIEVHGKRRLRGANHTVVSDRIETGTFLVAAAVTGGKLTLENAPCDARRGAARAARAGRGPRVLRHELDRDRRDRARPRRPACLRHRDRRPTRASRPTSSRRRACCSPRPTGTSRVHEAIFEDRIEWLAELRKLGADIDIADAHHASITGPIAPPRGRDGDRRPARRRLADPRRPGRRRDLADPRRAPRSAGV